MLRLEFLFGITVVLLRPYCSTSLSVLEYFSVSTRVSLCPNWHLLLSKLKFATLQMPRTLNLFIMFVPDIVMKQYVSRTKRFCPIYAHDEMSACPPRIDALKSLKRFKRRGLLGGDIC